MTQPHIPAHDADSVRDADAASTPSYPQRSTAQDYAATQELPAAQDATREMPSATTIPAPPAGTVPSASAPANPAPSAQQAPAAGGAYSAPSGEPYSGYAAPASPDAFASPTVIVTKKGPGWVALLGAMLLTIGLTLGAVF
ncbi:MAG: trypsin, partial [Actinomyces sp.]